MPSTISPNMGLIVPTVGSEPGPTWASDLNASLGTIDSHNHTSGRGVPIPPQGIDINSDLSFQDNNAINVRSLRFFPQTSTISLPSDIGCLYEAGVDLWYNDGNGNQIRITQAGNVVGSAGSITGLVPPASASYSSVLDTFIWQSGVGIPANMDFGSIIIRDTNSPYNGITISAPHGISAYAIQLPTTTPGQQSFMTMDASGNIDAPWVVDNSSIEVNSGTTVQVKALGISTGKIAGAAVTFAKLVATNITESGSSGSFSTSSGAFPTVVTAPSITTSGRSVEIRTMPDQSGSPASFTVTSIGAGSVALAQVRVVRNGSPIALQSFGINAANGSGSTTYTSIPPGSFSFLDSPAPGTYTYALQVALQTGSLVLVTNVKLQVHEVL